MEGVLSPDIHSEAVYTPKRYLDRLHTIIALRQAWLTLVSCEVRASSIELPLASPVKSDGIFLHILTSTNVTDYGDNAIISLLMPKTAGLSPFSGE